MSVEGLLNQVIGPDLYNPSGGQAKLLSFARALYKKNVYLYLLDEPTSDLSPPLNDLLIFPFGRYLYSLRTCIMCVCVVAHKF